MLALEGFEPPLGGWLSDEEPDLKPAFTAPPGFVAVECSCVALLISHPKPKHQRRGHAGKVVAYIGADGGRCRAPGFAIEIVGQARGVVNTAGADQEAGISRVEVIATGVDHVAASHLEHTSRIDACVHSRSAQGFLDVWYVRRTSGDGAADVGVLAPYGAGLGLDIERFGAGQEEVVGNNELGLAQDLRACVDKTVSPR